MSSSSSSSEESEFTMSKDNGSDSTTTTSKRPQRATRSDKKRNRDGDDDDTHGVTKKKRNQSSSSDDDDGAPFGLHWQLVGSVYAMTCDEMVPNEKVASFDMDDTLLGTASGRKFSTGRKDWKWWDASVLKKLKSLNEDGFKIVIFSNQQGIEKKKVRASDVCNKIIDLTVALGFPIQAFLAISGDNYRKPSPDMWYLFVDEYNGGVEAEKNEESFYCGDAAGRPAKTTRSKKKDFSCSDRKFALNIPIQFYTPETYFLEWDDQEYDLGFDPIEYLKHAKTEKRETKDLISTTQEIVVNVGVPGSGKSTFTEKHFVPNGYVRINKDTLKTQSKCEKESRIALEAGKSIVVDNTNPSIKARSVYLKMAKEFSIPARCFLFETPLELAFHLNAIRSAESDVKRVPQIAYNMFKKNFDEPDTSEGFKEVSVIKFSPDFNDDEDHLAHFKHYT